MYCTQWLRSTLVAGCTCAALLMACATAQAAPENQYYGAATATDAAQSDTANAQAPGRVARLAYQTGQVQFAPAGEDDWGSIEVNRPMVAGDRLLTGDDGLAVLELGDAAVRIDHATAFDFLDLAQGNVQLELSQGTLNLAVHQLDEGENFEVDTPTLAFVATTPGVYRIDNDPDGVGSMVTVFRGAGVVYGENGASRQVVAGTSYRFNDSTLTEVDSDGLPSPDDFDRFCESRDADYARYAQQDRQYVPPDMIGGGDLNRYGQWDDVPEYGNVWYPNSVPADWAPYRHGHWAWIDPWGWTWVGNEPWGFAPFHYGRWVHVRNRWGWMPGPVRVRPVYAPALVAFLGGSGLSVSIRIGSGGGPIGWFPLGPRDVYVPWFHASRHYFNRVNVTNIRNVYVNRTVINNVYVDYRHHRFNNIHRYNRYTNRQMPNAVTAVPRKVFTDARPVHKATLRLDARQLQRAKTLLRPRLVPNRASLGWHHPVARPAVLHRDKPFVKPVVARRVPPPRLASFTARREIIARQQGRPLTATQMHSLQRGHTAAAPREQRVKLVPRTRAPVDAVAPRGNSHRSIGRPITDSVLPIRRGFHNQIHPIPANPSVLKRVERLPQVPVIQPADASARHAPASGRLPVVSPIRPAPRPHVRRVDPRPQQPPSADRQAARNMRVETQLRAGARAQATQAARQQQIRTQQMQRQREASMQNQARRREQQMRQQGALRGQQQQLARERQVARQQQMQNRERAVQRQRPHQIHANPTRAPHARSQPTPQRHKPAHKRPRDTTSQKIRIR